MGTTRFDLDRIEELTGLNLRNANEMSQGTLVAMVLRIDDELDAQPNADTADAFREAGDYLMAVADRRYEEARR